MTGSGTLWRQLVFGFATQGLLFLQGLIVMPIVVRLGGAAVYGRYVLIATTVTLLFGVSALGAKYHFWRGLPLATSMAERRALMMPQFWFQGAAILLVGAVVTGLAPRAENGAAALACAWLVARFLFAQGCDYYRYTLRFTVFNIAATAPQSLSLIALAAAAIFGEPITLSLLVSLQVATLLLAAIPLLAGTFREIGFARPAISWREFAGQARQGLPLTLQFLADLLLASGDRYLILLFLSAGAVGRYQSAYQIAILLSAVPMIMGRYLPPLLVRLVDAGERHRAERVFDGFLQIFLMIGIPFTAGCAMIGNNLVALLATMETARAALWVTPLVALAGLLYGLMTLISFPAFALGRTRQILATNAIAILVSLGLCAAILPFWRSITVPAATTLVGYGIAALCALRFARRHWPIVWYGRQVFRYVLASAAMVVLLYEIGFVPGAVVPCSPARLAFAITAAVTCYLGALALTGGIGVRRLRRMVAGLEPDGSD